jgi:hypothetical protein
MQYFGWYFCEAAAYTHITPSLKFTTGETKTAVVIGRITAYYDVDLKKENNYFCGLGFQSTITISCCTLNIVLKHGGDYTIDAEKLELTIKVIPSQIFTAF